MERILKDIRIYESSIENISGNSTPHNLGKIIKPTKDTNYLAQRIARKLNELNCSFGEFDHIYINLTTCLKENEIVISDRKIDNKIKYIDFGINSQKVNLFTDSEKDIFLQNVIFRILNFISSKENISLIEKTEEEINKNKRNIEINYKIKETKSYKVTITYQIAPTTELSNMNIQYFNKKTNSSSVYNFELQFYDDIYPLVDTITIKDNKIIIKPKKSFKADLYNSRYKTPIEFEI